MVESKPESKVGVMCLLDDTTKEIHLFCGEDAVMHIKSVVQGYQDIPQDTTVCFPQVI